MPAVPPIFWRQVFRVYVAVEGSHVCVEEQVAPDSFGYELLEEVEELVHEPAVVDYVEAVHRKGEGYLKKKWWE